MTRAPNWRIFQTLNGQLEVSLQLAVSVGSDANVNARVFHLSIGQRQSGHGSILHLLVLNPQSKEL